MGGSRSPPFPTLMDSHGFWPWPLGHPSLSYPEGDHYGTHPRSRFLVPVLFSLLNQSSCLARPVPLPLQALDPIWIPISLSGLLIPISVFPPHPLAPCLSVFAQPVPFLPPSQLSVTVSLPHSTSSLAPIYPFPPSQLFSSLHLNQASSSSMLPGPQQGDTECTGETVPSLDQALQGV